MHTYFIFLFSGKGFFAILLFVLSLVISSSYVYANAEKSELKGQKQKNETTTITIPKDTPRTKILGHNALLVEDIKELPSSITQMRSMWQKVEEEHDTKVFQIKHSPLPQYKVQQWSALKSRFGKMSKISQLQAINGFFNNIPSKDDILNYGKDEYWAAPGKFMSKFSGDCEDYSISKYFALQHLGWKKENLFVLFLHDNINQGMHSVLAVKNGNKTFILDNLSRPAHLLVPAEQYVNQVKLHSMANYEGYWVFIK